MVMLCCMVADRRMVHRLLVHGMDVHAKLALHAGLGDRAQHGSRDRTPDREQDSKQQQEPETNSFHDEQVSTLAANSEGSAHGGLQ